MNREIKFRVWHEADSSMTDWEGINSLDKDGIIPFLDCLSNPKAIVMQYTGLKDKNGVEIYEGDILRTYSVDDGHLIEMVTFINGSFVLTHPNKLSWAIGDYKPGYLEVIGNIYSNPELL